MTICGKGRENFMGRGNISQLNGISGASAPQRIGGITASFIQTESSDYDDRSKELVYSTDVRHGLDERDGVLMLLSATVGQHQQPVGQRADTEQQ